MREWNVGHGFYSAPESQATKEKEKPNWLLQLEEFIRSHFGPMKDPAAVASDRSGDVAIVLMRLAKPVPAGEQHVVQFGRSAGDKNFDVVEGERFVLTEANWNTAVCGGRASRCEA